ncbi:MAG: hypothetical protein JW904_03225 [Spirochaetales bacterium]|nr:hypothetical protein [Spirochaetales bacterium]
MQIFPSQETDPLERSIKENKAGKAKTIDTAGKSAAKTSEEPVIDHTDANMSSGRMTLRIQRTISGFNELYSALKNTENPDDKNSALKTIISQTRFQNEQILREYEPQLLEIVRDNDLHRLLRLTEDTKKQLHQYAKNETISENLAAVESQNPESLVQSITATLRRKGLPELNIERTRIMDLLR